MVSIHFTVRAKFDIDFVLAEPLPYSRIVELKWINSEYRIDYTNVIQHHMKINDICLWYKWVLCHSTGQWIPMHIY